MAPFSKPETVLKQAEGLVSVGQTHAALQSLTEMFSSKSFRSTPLSSLEPIVLRFIELCVDMRKGRTAKEGLMQYRNIAQNTSVGSIEVVINRFVQLADAKVREAQEKAKVVVGVEVEDLEASETPESILLGAVSGDQSKDRTDRALVTPWLKFLWESYRTSLETLKNNARLEAIYQQVAQQAFKFCLQHQRKVEFRRLCETLRLHLQNVAKYSHQPHSINLTDPDTLQHHLDTRFAQLSTSVELELWQEAFRSVEDVHNLLTMAKKAPKPMMMAGYYEKLTRIFLMSGNALYHAAAWGRYYSIAVNVPGKSQEELGRLAGQVLVSALAVPVGLNMEEGEEKGKNSRLTALLGLSKTPTRASLLKDALSRDVLKLSPAPIKALYNLLEVAFDPLSLCASIAPIMHQLASDTSYAPYLPLLQRALLSRLLNQLSQVYSSIKIANLMDLVKPLREVEGDGDAAKMEVYTEPQIESYVMGCARRGELCIRVDHAEGSITFIDDPFSSSLPSSSDHERGGGTVQASMAELVRTRLSKLAGCLHGALEAISPPKECEGDAEKLTALITAADAERKALQLRRALVARRRELLAELSARKEKEEASRRAEASRREKEDEERRVREEGRRREIERARKDVESIRNAEALKLLERMKGSFKGQLDEIENPDTDTLMRLQVEQLEREKKGLNERLRVISKRVDHLERAYRKEELPLLAEDYARQQQHDLTTFEAARKARLDAAREKHKADLDAKRRLGRMRGDYERRREAVMDRRREEFERRKEAAERRIDEEKAKKRELVMKQREAAKKQREEEERIRREEEAEQERLAAERAAEEQRLADEEEAARAAAEAKKREEEEKVAEKRRQREAERAEADRMVQLQRKREEEAEERAKRRAALGHASTPSIGSGAARSASTSEATPWRRAGSIATPAVAPVSTRATPVAAVIPPLRSDSPAPPAKFKVGAVDGGWRAKDAAKKAAEAAGGRASPAPPPASPALPPPAAATPLTASAAPPAPKTDPKKDDDGFQTVEKKPGVWKPRRGRPV